jgi:ATP-dependent Clp protease ATP-binding subunit ClpA
MSPTEHLDGAARAALVLAQDEARRREHRYVGTEHLLLALARDRTIGPLLAARGASATEISAEIEALIGRGDRDTRPDVLLAAIGIDLADVRRRVGDAFGPEAISAAAVATRTRRRRWPGGRWWPGCDVGRPCTSVLAGQWLGMAPRLKKVLAMATSHGARLATPADLLMALLDEGKGVACQILERRHVDLAELRDAVRAQPS